MNKKNRMLSETLYMIMSKKQKIKFINSIINAIKRDILSKVDKMPASWNGKELRLYIADQFKRIVFGFLEKDKSLKRKYNKEVRELDL